MTTPSPKPTHEQITGEGDDRESPSEFGAPKPICRLGPGPDMPGGHYHGLSPRYGRTAHTGNPGEPIRG